MLEIEYLSDRIGLIVNGEMKETGHPKEIKERHGAKNLEEVFLKVAAK
jgi:ABC-2 type transport system ATP-binding protein